MSLLEHLSDTLHRLGILQAGRRLVIAFSGGPDSTALLWGLQRVTGGSGVELFAVHVDHALDEDSRRRAVGAERICRALEVPFSQTRRPFETRTAYASREADARRFRYRALERQRQHLDADYILTAHHADDQIETLLIRLLYGSGIEGLSGIAEQRGPLLRPLLGLRKQVLLRALRQAGLEPVRDPTNFHLHGVRNRIRHLLLPHLFAEDPELGRRLLDLSQTVAVFRSLLQKRLPELLDLKETRTGSSVDRGSLERLPAALWPFALAEMSRMAGIDYPPPAAAREELARQIRADSQVRVDCGSGWRWRSQVGRLDLRESPPSPPAFAYTVEAPGECVIPELALRFRIRRGVVDTWMFRSSSRRAGLDLPIGPGDRVIVRSRRPGDRVQPFGCSYTRRLKDVLIDRRVPRCERGRLPLLEVDSQLVWIPGVTICEEARVGAAERAWIAELEPIEDDGY